LVTNFAECYCYSNLAEYGITVCLSLQTVAATHVLHCSSGVARILR